MVVDMYFMLWLLSGVVVGGFLLLYARAQGASGERSVLTVALLVAALLYVAFAIFSASPAWVVVELVGIPVYGFFAFLAIRISYHWLAAGWAAHPAWDVLLHLFGPGRDIVPEWYAVACISFDLLVAGYVLTRVAHWRRQRAVFSAPA